MPQIVTIRQAVERAKSEGYPVSEFSLRRWCRTGEVSYRMAGVKILIYYPNLISYLTCSSTTATNGKSDASIIKK